MPCQCIVECRRHPFQDFGAATPARGLLFLGTCMSATCTVTEMYRYFCIGPKGAMSRGLRSLRVSFCFEEPAFLLSYALVHRVIPVTLVWLFSAKKLIGGLCWHISPLVLYTTRAALCHQGTPALCFLHVHRGFLLQV